MKILGYTILFPIDYIYTQIDYTNHITLLLLFYTNIYIIIIIIIIDHTLL